MHSNNLDNFTILRAAVTTGAAFALLTGCPAEDPAADGGTTGGGPMMTNSTSDANPTMPPSDDDDDDNGEVDSAADAPLPETSAGTDTTDGDGGSTSTTGDRAECVDEDLGMATGAEIVMGSSADQGDDFDWSSCAGGFDTSGEERGSSDVAGGTTSTATAGTSNGGFDSGGSGDSGGKRGPGDDYVVAWTAPSTGPYTVSVEGSQYDTILAVTPPMCGAESLVCNDDCFELQSGLVFDARRGETVFIVIDGYGGQTGSFTLSITEGDTLECAFGDERGETSSTG